MHKAPYLTVSGSRRWPQIFFSSGGGWGKKKKAERMAFLFQTTEPLFLQTGYTLPSLLRFYEILAVDEAKGSLISVCCWQGDLHRTQSRQLSDSGNFERELCSWGASYIFCSLRFFSGIELFFKKFYKKRLIPFWSTDLFLTLFILVYFCGVLWKSPWLRSLHSPMMTLFYWIV